MTDIVGVRCDSCSKDYVVLDDHWDTKSDRRGDYIAVNLWRIVDDISMTYGREYHACSFDCLDKLSKSIKKKAKAKEDKKHTESTDEDKYDE